MKATAKKPKNIDEYLARVNPDQRVALEKLRRTIQKAAPGAVECISYQLPAFRLKRLLVCFGAAKNHCALYPMSAALIAAHHEDLKDFDTSKGTIRFQPDHPLPATLVRKFIKERLAQMKR